MTALSYTPDPCHARIRAGSALRRGRIDMRTLGGTFGNIRP